MKSLSARSSSEAYLGNDWRSDGASIAVLNTEVIAIFLGNMMMDGIG
jgi:hypothetical protein